MTTASSGQPLGAGGEVGHVWSDRAMRKDFFPKRHEDILPWSTAFLKNLSPDPQAVGVSQQHLDQYALAHEEFIEAHHASQRVGTRTRISVSRKDEKRAVLESEARTISRIVHSTPGVSDAQKVALGLSVRRGGGRSPRIGAPTCRLSIEVQSVRNRTVTIVLNDLDHPRRGRPGGVAGAVIFSAHAEQAPTSRSGWAMREHTAETKFDITFEESLPPGAKIWLTGYWVNPRLQRGEFADPVSTNLQGGGISLPMNLKVLGRAA